MSTPSKGAMCAAAECLEVCHGGFLHQTQDCAEAIDNHTNAISDELGYCLHHIISDLPTKRDWLSPDIEKMARAALARYQQIKAKEPT